MNETHEVLGTLQDVIGMEFTHAEPGLVRVTLKVTRTVCQAYGFLNGGATLAMAETMAGYGSSLLCGEDEISLGVQVSGNHVRAVRLGGVVYAEARIISKTRTLHVWNVDVTDEEGRLVSTSRITNCITKRKPA